MQTELFIDTEPKDIISKDIIAFLALANLQGIGYWTLYNIAKKGINFGSFFSFQTIDEFNNIYGKILHKQFPTDNMPWAIVKRHLWEAGIKYLKRLEQFNIKLIFHTDSHFPIHLKKINDPPYWLFYEGNLDNIRQQGVCIVGARVTPPSGIFLAQYATYCLKSLEVPTISGLATGIDQIVHQTSIESGIPTIAVLGTGILKNYPIDSIELRKSIIKNGGTIVSEYLPHANYSAENFVRRNRIQAALCKILIPAYWRIKSGTAHTVEFAFKMDRKIICLQTIDINETFEANSFAIRNYEANNFIIPNDHEKLINCLTSTSTLSRIKKADGDGSLMAKLKAVVLSVRDVILDNTNNLINNDIYNELILFIKFCYNKNVKVFLHSNDCWEFSERDLGTYFSEKSGCVVTYYNPIKFTDLPKKPKASSIEYILHSNSLNANEVICIGATDNDMRTYVNGKVLFLKASWYHSSLKYGFKFDSLKDIARFIETCCLRDHLWFHKFNIHPIIYYSLSPFSTLKEDFKDYSTSARLVTKHGTGLLDFWLQLLIASIYFSDLNDNFDYLVAYPGHKAGSGNPLMDEYLDILAKALRKKYLPNFLIRHKDSIKSQTARQNRIKLDIFNQLNTLVLNKTPRQGLNGKPYTSIIPTKQKTVILIDDICTSGYSLDAGRIFLKQAGLKVICFSLLKTINVPFTFMINPPEFNPYVINNFHSIFNNCNISTLETPYKSMIVDSSAPIEINEIFNKFKSWDWS